MITPAEHAFPRRILLIDDHPLVLSGIAEMLRAVGCVVAVAGTVAEARQCMHSEDLFDVMLLDINLGRESGLSLLEDPPANIARRVILLSGVTEQEIIIQGFGLGAFGFIPKSVRLDEVSMALREMMIRPCLENSGWIWSTDAGAVVDAYEVFPRHTVLTPKERDVFMQLRDGLLDKQIADQLGLSIHTVRVHIRAIKRKRGHNRRFENNV